MKETVKRGIIVREERQGLWYATLETTMGIKGYPMGRGKDQNAAVDDLIYRVGFESEVLLEPTTITNK